MKYIIGIIAIIVAFFTVYIVAEAAKEISRGVLIGTVSGAGTEEIKVYKLTDGKTDCYIIPTKVYQSISCVK